jgi:methylthioribulose-1-phosphate dehydratase
MSLGGRDVAHQSEENEARDVLATAVRRLAQRGWTPATSSNFSVRLRAEHFSVSASGLDKESLSREQFVRVDMYGRCLAGESGTASAETLLHAAIYRRAPQAACILHTHSVVSTVLSRQSAAKGSVILTGYELLKAFQGIKTHQTSVRVPVFANSQDMELLAAEVSAWFDQREETNGPVHGFLIDSHGLYAWGDTVAQATRHLEAFEFLFACELREASLWWPPREGALPPIGN